MIHIQKPKLLAQFFGGFFLLLGPASCVSTNFSSIDLPNSKPGPNYWLTTSMFSGPFYDDTRLNLLDSRPFSAVNYAKTLDGFTVFPPNAERIVSAGTKVSIEKVEYPSAISRLKRPIYAPSDKIWVYLKIAKKRGEVSVLHEKTHIFVLPSFIKSESDVKKYLSQFFSREDPNAWLLTQSNHFQKGIRLKRPLVGMSKEHLIAALGFPIRKQVEKVDDFSLQKEVWHYPNYFVAFEKDIVVKAQFLNMTNNS